MAKRKRKPQIESKMLLTTTQYPNSKEQKELEAQKEAENRAYEKANREQRERAKVEAKQLELSRKQLSVQTEADARAQITKIKEQEKALKKKLATEAKIEKAGGTEYIEAKKGHVKIKRGKQVRKWKKEAEFEKRPRIIKALTKRKKGKRGTSPIGNVVQKVLYPLKPRKVGRW